MCVISKVLTFVLLMSVSSVLSVTKRTAHRDDVINFLNEFGRRTGRPTADDLDDAVIDHIASKMGHDELKVLSNNVDHLVGHRLHLDEKMKNDGEASVNSNNNHKVRRMMRYTNGDVRRRMIVNQTCVNDPDIFCDPATPAYTTDGTYETVAEALQFVTLLPSGDPSIAIQSYTDADVYATGLIVVHGANLLLSIFDDWCDTAATCAGSVPIFGDLAECIIDATCTTVSTIANAIVSAAEFGLDYADFHDGVLLTTQMQALFEDRQHIIANQEYLASRIQELKELMIELHNAQTEWLNVKLNSIGILLRTPSGRRPGWNDQDLTDIVDDPTSISPPLF